MIIDCISDLHGYKPELQGGDLLIVAGDLTARDKDSEYIELMLWLTKQDYKKKVMIAGNHDGKLEAWQPMKLDDVDYLCDSATEYEGLKIWGAPWTPTFYYWYFMKDRGEPIKEMWDKIPDDVDILVTHGPPYGILDNRLGCMDLTNALPRLTKLKLHVFGHIHESPGQEVINGTTFVNASIMDKRYRPFHKPIRIIL